MKTKSKKEKIRAWNKILRLVYCMLLIHSFFIDTASGNFLGSFLRTWGSNAREQLTASFLSHAAHKDRNTSKKPSGITGHNGVSDTPSQNAREFSHTRKRQDDEGDPNNTAPSETLSIESHTPNYALRRGKTKIVTFTHIRYQHKWENRGCPKSAVG